MEIKRQRQFFLAVLLTIVGFSAAKGQTTAFAYQGKLTDAGALANGSYDLQFTLWDAVNGGTQQPQPAPVTVTKPVVVVSSGAFSVQLDFGVNAFPGANRFLEISVRPAGGGLFTTLSPRQQISSTPYAIRTVSAGSADSLSNNCVACVQDSQINSVSASKLSGALPVASLPGGSANYIQNGSTPQPNANFNILGNGTVGGDLTVTGTLNANVGGNFIQNRTTQQTGANFNVSGNGTIGGTLSANNGGFGTTTPLTKLDVRGHLILDPGSSPVLYTSTASSEQNRYLQLINSPSAPSASGLKAGGLLIADSYGFANPAKNDLIVKGNTGIGTGLPASKLHVVGSASILTPFRGMTIDQTVQPGQDFSGYALKVTTTSNGFTDASLLIDSVGNVGVGVASPQSKLHIAGNVIVDGNAGQSATGYGWVKAMLYVGLRTDLRNFTDLIERCYKGDGQPIYAENLSGNNVQVCGITLTPAPDNFTHPKLTFPFSISKRFFQLTVDSVVFSERPGVRVLDDHTVEVNSGGFNFYLFVF